MSYQAIALSNRFESGRKSGEISIEYGNVVFRYDQESIVWTLTEIEFSVGGAGNSLIYLKNAKHPEITLYTHDKKMLKDRGLDGTFATHQSVLAIKKRYYTRWVVGGGVAVMVVAMLVLLFSNRTTIVRKIADKVPVEYEQKAGEQLFSLLSTGYKLIDDTLLNEQFNQIVAPLVGVVEDSDHKFSFYIINDTTVNAFALPGGKVVVNSGLILKSDNWNEIQGVLAHEISHVTLRHHVRGVINNQGFFFVVSALLGGYSDLVAVISGYGSRLESLMYSRRFEFEADNRAFDYMTRAGIDPQGMITFFEKLQKMHGDSINNNYTSILSTHPPTADRIDNLKEKVKTSTAQNLAPEIHIEEFKKQLKSKL
jgi:predicted Zn-dependent protease